MDLISKAVRKKIIGSYKYLELVLALALPLIYYAMAIVYILKGKLEIGLAFLGIGIALSALRRRH